MAIEDNEEQLEQEQQEEQVESQDDALARKISELESSIMSKMGVIINGMESLMASHDTVDDDPDEPVESDDVEPDISAEDVEEMLGIKD